MDLAIFNGKYKEVLLSTFRRTIEFLDTHHIKWYVGAGTCIGTIRHQGIIPWDDDIDLYVPREDYEKLFGIRDQLKPYALGMKSIEDGYGYYNGFIKIYDSNTTLWERKEFEEVIGIYVDVFPLERSDISKSEFVEVTKTYRKSMYRYLNSICQTSFSDYCRLLSGFHLRTIMKRLYHSVAHHDTEKDYQDFVASTRQVSYVPDGKYVMNVMGSYGDREYWLAEWFDDIVEMPFDDFMVKVPSGYHKYLTQLYGDYMQLPPMEKRVSRHSHYYCNFKESLSLDEVKERIRKGETCVM